MVGEREVEKAAENMGCKNCVDEIDTSSRSYKFYRISSRVGCNAKYKI